METRFRRSLVAIAGALAFAAVCNPAFAGDKPGNPGSSAAVAQYVEQIPTSSGSRAAGVGKVHTKPLAAKVKKKLQAQAGKDAPLLEQVATSSAYGAPQQTVEPPPPPPAPATTTTTTPTKTRPAQSARPRPHPRAAVAAARRLPRVTSNPTPTRALSAAANVVTEGSNSRMLGLAAFLVIITAAALGAAAYRQRTRGPASSR